MDRSLDPAGLRGPTKGTSHRVLDYNELIDAARVLTAAQKTIWLFQRQEVPTGEAEELIAEVWQACEMALRIQPGGWTKPSFLQRTVSGQVYMGPVADIASSAYRMLQLAGITEDGGAWAPVMYAKEREVLLTGCREFLNLSKEVPA